MLRPFIALSAVSILAACATPQERCIATANRDVVTLDSLIAQSEANVTRGFAVETRLEPGMSLQFCAGNRGDNLDFLLCQMNEPREKTVPVAIDLDLEKRKLAQMKAKRAELARALPQTYAQCRAQYPT